MELAARLVMEPLVLVVLAAGRSTRFGRPKQVEPVGPRGEAIMDVTMRDAFASGCDQVRLIVHPEHDELFRQRYRGDRRVIVLVQPAALGTAHATMVGMEHAAGTCIVVNGDDLYGARSMELAVVHAREEHALVVFELGNTLSPNGPVNRAVCHVEGTHLIGTEEVKGLVDAGNGHIIDGDGRSWDRTVPVSMNLWVFRPGFRSVLIGQERSGDPMDPAEHGLPDAVRAAMASHQLFRVLRTNDRWCGLTFPDDAELVRRFLAQ
jgi:MobA-like NTP transferase domain